MKNDNLYEIKYVEPYEAMDIIIKNMAEKMESHSNFVFINLVDSFLKLGEEEIKLIKQFYKNDSEEVKKKCIEILNFQRNVLDKRLKLILSLPDANISWSFQEVLMDGKNKLDKNIESMNNQTLSEESNSKKFVLINEFKSKDL